jgi:phosphotransferase system HPr (HPr) family protein
MVKASARFDAAITVRKGALEANAKSIMSLLMLGVAPGDELMIVAEGRDAMEAADALEQVLAALNTGGLEAVAIFSDACPGP